MRLSAGISQPQQDKPPSGRSFVLLLFLLVLLVAVFLFVNSPFFLVDTVTIEGNTHMERDEICRIAGIPDSVNIFRLNTTAIEKRLIGDLRLTDVSVSRRFPSEIVIAVRERRPVAYVACSYGFVQIDGQAMVLSAHKHLSKPAVPFLSGLRLGHVYIGDNIETEQIRAILPYLAALDEGVLRQIADIDVRSPRQFTARSAGAVTIRLGDGTRLEEKARLTGELLSEIAAKKLPVEYIDMNFATPFIKLKQ